MKTIVVDGLSALQGGGQTYLKNLFDHFDPSFGLRVVALVPERYREEGHCEDAQERKDVGKGDKHWIPE